MARKVMKSGESMFLRLSVCIHVCYQVLVILNEVEVRLFLIYIDDTSTILLLLFLDNLLHDITFAYTTLPSQNNQYAPSK